jgi:hypothetical protein
MSGIITFRQFSAVVDLHLGIHPGMRDYTGYLTGECREFGKAADFIF